MGRLAQLHAARREGFQNRAEMRTRSARTIVTYFPGPQSCCSVQVTSAIHPRWSSQSRQAA